MRIATACVGLAALAVSGCAARDGGCGSIGLADYDNAFQSKLSAEIAVAGPNADWPSAVGDYRALREAVRACQEKAAAPSGISRLWK